MAPGEDVDSGMESQEGSQALDDTVKEEVFTAGSDKPLALEEAGDDDEPDETLGERLWGLTEMFPETLRNATHSAVTNTKSGMKLAYGFSRSALWVVFSTSIILFAPVIFEVERAQMEEMQKTQQKQMLLGPSSVISGGVPPPIMPVQQR